MNAKAIQSRAALVGLAVLTSLALFFLLAAAVRADEVSTLDAEFSLQAGYHALFSAPATGEQIYECTAVNGSYAWKLTGIDARLLDSDGHVFATQTDVAQWVASDGSRIDGQVGKSVDARSGALPDQLYAVNVKAAGLFSNITTVVRDNAIGGLPPAQACDTSSVRHTTRVPFKADYIFFEAAS